MNTNILSPEYDNLAPICLPLDSHKLDSNITNVYGTVTGWGSTGTGNFDKKKLFDFRVVCVCGVGMKRNELFNAFTNDVYEIGGPTTTLLQQITVPLVTNDECNKAYDTVLGMAVYFPHGISNELLCAGYEDGGKDACQVN